MVTPRAGEAGKAKLGCLVSVLVAVAGLYVVKDFGTVYWRYYQMQDEVKSQADFAPSLSDAAIRDRLVATADTLGLPLGPTEWTVRRQPSGITIHAEYTDSVVLEVLSWRKVIYMHFAPGAEAPL